MKSGSMVVLNGELLPRSGARIGVDDAGFLRGDGVFETLRAEAGAPLRIDAHLERLERSLALLGIALPWGLDDLRAQVDLVLDVNGLRSGAACVRITVTRGVTAPGMALGESAARPRARSARLEATHGPPTVLVSADPYEPPPTEVYRRGVDVQVSSHVRHPHPLHTIKSTSHAGSSWLRREARDPRVFEVLQFNDSDFLAEGSFTNVFVIDGNGILRTPLPEEGCLEGVTRGAILELARDLGLRIAIGRIAREVLEGAAEMFLTSSLAEIVPVRSVERRELPAPCPGPLTVALRDAYSRQSRAQVPELAGRRQAELAEPNGAEHSVTPPAEPDRPRS